MLAAVLVYGTVIQCTVLQCKSQLTERKRFISWNLSPVNVHYPWGETWSKETWSKVDMTDNELLALWEKPLIPDLVLHASLWCSLLCAIAIFFILAFLLALIIKRKIIAGKIKLWKIYNLFYFLLLYCIQILVIIFPSSHVSLCLFVSISFSLSHTQNYFLRLNVPEGRHISMRFF